MAMTTHAAGGYQTRDWDEQAYNEQAGEPKFTQVRAVNMYQGDLVGDSQIDLLMVYPNDNFCSFTGLEHITGRLGERKGSFVLQQSGTFQDGAINCEWFVVPGSGTGELSGL